MKCKLKRKVCIRQMRPLLDIIHNLFDDYDGHRFGLALVLCKLLGECLVNVLGGPKF